MEINAAVSEKIATLLTTNGILSQDRLTKITIQCAQNKEKIIPELLKKDFIKEEDIVKVISRSFAIKINNITEDQIKPEVLKILPVDFIKKEKIIPYDLESGTLKLAIADPSKINFSSKIKNFTKKNVVFSVTTFSNIEKLAELKIWNIASATPTPKPKVKSSDTSPKGEINIIEFVDQIFQQSLKDGTSDIHI